MTTKATWDAHTATQPLLGHDVKWNLIYKNAESPCCTPVTIIILYINYTSRKEEREKKEICEFENRKSMKQLNKKLAI